ncbi:hypothetical protein BJ508DRAFT_173932 [Ascobolus immersus RN42]|uniref:Uncharacterized protein n=1 Tax=Ascobolus immersus RN42 TaxID=1160509 RepID=A0A3N4HTZ5_ASCIM|nr:hypothetical protein BJ508DRAFT_173932 [Ascobolus immersus RN42]
MQLRAPRQASQSSWDEAHNVCSSSKCASVDTAGPHPSAEFDKQNGNTLEYSIIQSKPHKQTSRERQDYRQCRKHKTRKNPTAIAYIANEKKKQTTISRKDTDKAIQYRPGKRKNSSQTMKKAEK